MRPIHTFLLNEMAAQGGRIPFCRFMEAALYHPDHGYYMTQRPRIGRGGDFVTAPELTSLFGELLALQIIEVWETLGRPQPFTVVEMGGGTGRLAADVLTTCRRFPFFLEALSYVLVETSPDFRVRQEQLLRECGFGTERITWRSDLPGQVGDGVIFGNEFLDALPVHWVEMTPEGLREVAVEADGEGRLATRLIAPQPPLEGDYFQRAGIDLEAGYRTEVAIPAARWVQAAAGALGRGLLLLIDYGYPAGEYYASWRSAGTLVGHRGHERVDDPLLFCGEMDLTAHVDFSAMTRAGREAGLELLGYTTQNWFLMGLGILERLERVGGKMAPEASSRLRGAVMRLLMPNEMGERFKALAMGRGMKEGTLAGFRLNDQRQRL
ncbi:MAG: SAM-dependent methyltransferase [Magnetococcales bacterium]|nr:SAM-dependent methyltransferase [Magnetococcales bacterium]